MARRLFSLSPIAIRAFTPVFDGLWREVRDVPYAIALLDAGRAGWEQRTPR
jgi:hypothetical protein